MATRHELIHIDFVANAGKANPVMKSLQTACDDTRVAKEKLDKELADAKAAGASAKVIADIEGRLKAQTKTLEALQKGMREYTKGIDTLSKGIKEFNQGTLDQMSAKFNKSVYNAAKLVQSTVETGSKYWNQLQRLMDATDRNVTRAKEDIVTMMQSLKDGSSVSTVQLTRAKEVLEDLSRLAVTNSEDWRNMKAQMNEVAQAIEMVAATERSLKGEIASEQDALRLSNALTQESINLRHADGEAAMQAAKKEREGIEGTMKGLSDKMAQRSKELDELRDEIEQQEHLDEVIKKRDQKIADARSRKQQAEQIYDEADRFIKAYDAQAKKVGELEKEVDELTKEQGKEAKAAEKAAEKAEKHAEAVGKQQEKVSGLEKEVEKLEQDLDTLSKQPVKPTVDTSGVDDAKKKINQEPIKPKVDDSEVKALEARLKAIQDAIAEKRQQIEAESKKGAGSISQWEETLKRVQGSKDGRLTAMGLGDDKKQMDDMLDVANRFYEIIKKVKGATEDKFFATPAVEPVKQLAEYYQITEEEARKLVKTLERSDVVQKKFANMRYDDITGFMTIQKSQGTDDQQIRIEAAQSYLEKAREHEAGQTEKVNKLKGELNDLEQKEAEQKEKIAAASEKAAQAAEQQNEATDKKIKLTKKEQQELERLTKDNQDLDSAIELLKKHRDELTASEDKGADAAKKGAEASKEEAQAIKMTAEEAKAALEEMKKLSSFEYKGGKLQISNPEEAQNFLRNSVKQHGIISKDGSYMLQSGKPVNDVVDDFKKRYNIEGGKKETLDIIRQLITGTDNGLIKSGFENSGNFSFKIDNEKLAARTRTMQELLSISKGITEAVKEQTAAEQAQEIMVKRLRDAYQHENEELERRKKVYQQRLADADAIGGPTEINGKLTQRGLEEQRAEEYKQKYIEGEKGQQAVVDKAYAEYQAAKTGAIKAETAATDANTKAKKDNISVEQQKKQIDEQIAALEQQKAGNTERLTQLQEKGAKAAKKNAEATQEQTQAVKESADAEMTMEQLLKRREDLDSKLAAKKEQLRKAQEELEKMTKSETAAEKEQSDVTARLTQKQAEYNEELEKMGQMGTKEARDQAVTDRTNAKKRINRADESINTTMREVIPERKSEEEMTQMRQKAEDLQKEINDLTQAFDQNAQAITNLNRKETEAAIEMAQSENVSIEKVKQAIELLKKKIETEATDAKTMQERGDAINRLSERLTQMNAEVAKLSQPIADRLKVDDLGTLSETEIRQGIEAAKQLIQTYKSGSDEANELANNIARADQYLRDNSVDAARQAQQQAAQLELMKSRMDNLGTLSNAAFAETKKFWQAMYDGAEKNDPELKNIEERLKNINTEEAKRSRAALEQSAGRLGRTNLGTLSANELRQSIEDAKKLQGAYAETSKEAQALAQMIVKAEEYAKTHGVEAVRQAQKEKEAVRQREEQEQQLAVQMRQRLMERKTLSADALAETKKYWLAQKNGAEEGTLVFRRAEAALKMLDNVESERNRERQGQLADRLNSLSLKNYSTAEIKEAIEAAKQLVASYKSGSHEATELTNKIIAAEEHLEKYSIEAARKTKKQNDELQEQQQTLLKSQADGFANASMDQLDEAIKRLKAYQTQIKDPNGWGKGKFDAVGVEIEKLTAQLNALKGVTEKTKGAFASADEVLARFDEHLGSAKVQTATQQTEKLAQTLDEKLNAATSEYDENIKNCLESIDAWEKELKESEDNVASLEAEYNNLVKLLNSGNPFKRLQGEMKGGWKRANNIQSWLEGDESGYNYGWRPAVNDAKNNIRSWKERLDYWKKQKAEALGLNEAEEQVVQTEEKLQQTRRMTREEMQQGIKILEEEAMAQDRSTADGQKKWEQLRSVIDQMNQELKESTGEWMKLADAEKLAEQAGENYYLDNSKKGFYASPEEIQKATAALNRQRETLIKTIQAKKANGDATKEEEKKLADLTKKLKDLKFEQDNLNMSQEKMRMLMKQPTEAISLDELRSAIKRADGELKRMEGSLGKNSKQYKEFADEVKNAKNVLKEMEGQANATSSAWDKAWSRLKTYVGMYMGFNMLWQKMTGTMDDMMTLSDKMGEVRKTTGFTADEVGRLSDNLAKLDTRTNLTGLMEFSSLAGSIGLKTQEAVQGFTEAANMIAVSLPEMGNDASRTLMKIADATGDLEKNGGNVRETLERVGSTIIALRANSAAAAGPITDFVSRVGAVGAQAGISIDQIAALGATVDALGGRVEMSATALSRMIPAIRNNTFEVAKAIGMTEKELKGKTGMEQMVAVFKALNKSVKQFDMTTEKGMNGAADAVENLLSKAGPNMQEVMKELNQQGARAGIVFGLLSQNVDKLEGQLDTASEAYKKNMALLDEYNKMNDTTAARWERMKNQIEEMFVSDNMQHWLGLLIKGLREVVDLISMDGPIGDFFRFSLIYFALWKAKWAEAMGTALMSLGQFLTATEASTAASTADAAAKTAEAAATEGVAVANEKAAGATGKFGKALKANLIGLAVTAVVFLGMKLLDMSRNAKKAATELDTLAKAEKRAADESVNERAKLEQLYRVTQDQNRSMEERRKALHDMVGDAKYKEYQEDLLTESNLAATAAKAYGELATQIVKAAKARVYQEEIEKLAQENLKLEDANEEAEKYVKDKKSSYERVSQNVATTPVAAGMFGTTAAAAQTHNDGQRQFLREYEQKQQDIIDNQEKIKKNNETIGKFEQKLKDTGVKLGGEEGDGNGGGGGGGGTNPYGNYDKVTSPYSEWNGDDLVARRKEMLERVKALANGADVQAVLSEDAKFISDAVRKNIKTTEQAIEWYNTERLKIQDALHAKHLTNTGDWLDPKKGSKRARKVIDDEMKYYMDELDAYYTERKAKIQEAQNDEEISEAEARNRTLANEAEWRQRRAELQQLYAKKSEKVTKEEQDAIFNILSERTGESVGFIQKDIAQTIKFIEKIGLINKATMDRILGDLDKDIETDFLRQRNAIGKHMKAIQDIIDKERPFNGITKNLNDNLTTMGILTGHMQKEMEELMAKNADMTDFNNRQAAEAFRELTFLLGESEHAFSTTIEEVMKRATDEGLTAWVEYMKQNPKMQEGLMAQLRSTYDTIQDAIKKEASLMKKQAEIMWNNILLPGGDGKTTMKEAFEKTIAQLGIDQGRVSRANSLIGAGQASERVADKLAIKQMQLQLAMQDHYYSLMKKQGQQRVDMLDEQAKKLKQQAEQMKAIGKEQEAQKLMDEYKAKMLDKQHAEMSLNLATTKEQTDLLKQQEDIIARTEESQARLYKELREWGDLIASSLQGVMEASHTADRDYYNERAKLNLTGKGGPGAGTYIVIENEGTSDATAHYEYLDERQALERQRQIENDNAVADAWKKVMDDLNQKMSDSITDWMNAALQNQSIDANTSALNIDTEATKLNTAATDRLTDAVNKGLDVNVSTQPASGVGKGGNAPEFTPQSMKLEVDTVQAVKDLTAIPGVDMNDNTLTLKFDSTEAVKQFQKMNKLKPDGIVGPKTLAKLNAKGITKATEAKYEVNGKTIGFDDEQAVRDFQKQYGITQTGTVGPKTMAKLDELGATKVQDMTFSVSLKDEKALDYVEELNTFKLADKTVDVKVNDQMAMDAIAKMQDVSIKDKQFTITARMRKDGELPTDSEFANDKRTGYQSGGSQVESAPSNIDFATSKQMGYPSGDGVDAANTDATVQNTQAVQGLTQAINGQSQDVTDFTNGRQNYGDAAEQAGQTAVLPDYIQSDVEAQAYGKQDLAGGIDGSALSSLPQAPWQMPVTDTAQEQGAQSNWMPPMLLEDSVLEFEDTPWAKQMEYSHTAADAILDDQKKVQAGQKQADNTMQKSSQSAFAKMTQAANLYGIAYQVMSNDNLDATQKFQMIAIQAAGQAAITSLTTSGVKMVGDTAVQTPSVLSKIMAELGPIAGPIAFGAFTALLGGLMGLATSKLAKSKSQIAQITGASVGAGRLSTGMLTYAEGNVNEFTDPDTLTPGRSYNVDAADGRTYRAKYTGRNPKTHITSGPEFHLSGEKGREMIIDAGTTRQITMNENEVWRTIRTLSGGGRIASRRTAGHGMRAFADGNVDEFDEMADGGGLMADSGMSMDQLAAFQQSLDRNSAIMERLEANGIHAYFDVYGKGGLVDSYDTGKKNVTRHGERY